MTMGEFTLIAESLEKLHAKVDDMAGRLIIIETERKTEKKSKANLGKFVSAIIGGILTAGLLKLFHLA
jgi:hypothetical protein